MPRHAKAAQERAKSHTFTMYDDEWSAIIRMVKAKRLQSPFDVFRLALSQVKEPELIQEKHFFHYPRFASPRTAKNRVGKLSRKV